MRIAIYLRVSTEEQRERQSIATQRDFAERYCGLHQLPVHQVYADDGVSGAVPLDRRPDGSHILSDARLQKFDELLVYRLDRLGRDTRLILNAVAELEKCGVRVRSMTEEFDTSSATGRLMLTMLSGFAAHERDVIRERSLAGTNRVAQAGVWLGGIVPFGYRKVGERGSARLMLAEQPIPDLAMSEADVIRLIYRLAATEKQSCQRIAGHLNQLHVPCSYVRDGRTVLRGKRQQRTSGVWHPGRVRSILVNTTYMGRHEYGKRSPSPNRQLITRAVPAIVGEEIWRKAQQTLQANFLFGRRSARNEYLLRGLIKCGLCGHTYIGTVANRARGNQEFYYRCNAAHSRAIYSAQGRCPSKAIRGDHLEEQVWSDVETFLRHPGAILDQLRSTLENDSRDTEHLPKQLARLEGLLAEKTTERARVLALYRRGRLTEAELDQQMDEVGKEEAALHEQAEQLRCKLSGANSVAATIESAQTLLDKLRARLDEPISWELKRRLIEVVVAGIRVDSVERDGVKESRTTVTYRFTQPDHPLPLVLPQSYGNPKPTRIPTVPQSVGDHIRKRRLALKLMQKQVAERTGVTEATVFNWEANTRVPEFRHMPAIIRFLGFNPLPEATTLGQQLVRQRMTLGLSQKQAARQIGVDPATLARWERGERAPGGALLTIVNAYLNGDSHCVPGFLEP